MEELNKHTLQHALAQLPVYEPQADLWGRIELGLAQKEALQSLPEYNPPPQVWEGIAAALDKPQKQQNTPRLRRIQWLAAAAVLTGISFGLMLWLRSDPPARVAMQYTQEAGSMVEVPAIDPDDEAAFTEIPRQFAALYSGKQEPIAQELQSSLEELNSAVGEIRGALKDYGADPELVQQLTLMERERTDVLKQMADLL